MVVPIYLELADGKYHSTGLGQMIGSKTVETRRATAKAPSPVKRAMINYYYDVLSTEN